MADMFLVGGYYKIKAQLMVISSIANFRKRVGWTALQSDEVWWYETENDQYVCPKCQELEAMSGFNGMRGDFIRTTLTYQHVANESDPNLKNLRRPETHLTFDGMGGSATAESPCRCYLHWEHPAYTCAVRLVNEFYKELK